MSTKPKEHSSPSRSSRMQPASQAERTSALGFVVLFIVFCVSCDDRSVSAAPESPPQVSMEATVWFNYPNSMNVGLGSTLTTPNVWVVESKITNNEGERLEVLPIYYFSEGEARQPSPLENAKGICPTEYKGFFTKESGVDMRFGPEDLSGTTTEGVFIPQRVFHEPPDIGTMGGMVGSKTFSAAIDIDTKPAKWETLALGSKGNLKCEWGFWSLWAASEKTRSGADFTGVHLGPLIRRAAPKASGTYLLVATLKVTPGNNSALNWKQSQFELLKVSPDLPKELSAKFGRNLPSVGRFGEALLKADSKAASKP